MPRVEIREHGSRPSIMTPARLNAPQAAKVIADLAHHRNAADLLSVVIDWQGDELFGDGSPGAKPIVYIYAAKYFQNINRTAYIEIPLDMEEAFGQSNFSNLVAEELVQYIIEEFERKQYESQTMKGAN